MKNSKKYTLAAIMAIVTTIVLSAFGWSASPTTATQQWHRVLLQQENNFVWKIGAPSSPSCLTSADICNVTLPAALNPAEMTTQQIKDNAVDGQYQTGYTTD